jgi:TPR repeat protein
LTITSDARHTRQIMHTLYIILLVILVLPLGQTAAFPPSNSKDLHTVQAQASQGDAEAQNSLGELYAKGMGMPQDYAQARAWYEKAATQGHPLAQNNLAELYFAALGGPQDYVRAYMWVNLAAGHMQGEEKKQAEDNREDVAQRMTPAQITEAKRLSEHCRSKKFKGC